MTISDNNGGSATITNGKLSYTIETPNNLETWADLQDYIFYIFYNYDNVTASNSSAKGFILSFSSYNANTSYYLRKQNEVYNIGNTSGTVTYESVMYVYVDKDVTITGKGKTDTDTEDGYKYTSKTNNFSLALKTGWNAVYTKQVSSATYATSSTTKTISLNNPSLKWILNTYEYDYDSSY